MADNSPPFAMNGSSRRTFLRGLGVAGIGMGAFAGEGLAVDSDDEDRPGPRTPSVRWKRTYGGAGEERATDIAPTADGGHVVSGVGDGAELVKLSGGGETEWTLDVPAFEGVTSVVQAKDGGYVLAAGQTVVKLDPRCRREWVTTLDFSVSDLIQTADGSYVTVGGGTAALDASGTVEWSLAGEELPPPVDLNELDPSPGIDLNAVVQTESGRLVAGGRRQYIDEYTDARTELFLITVDRDGGDPSLTRLFSNWGAGGEALFFGGVAPAPDGGFVLALEGGTDWDSLHLQKRSRTGELEFSREGRIAEPGYEEGYSSIAGLVPRDDEGYVLATAVPEELCVDSVCKTGNVFGLDANLNLRWGATYTRDDTEGVIRALASAGDGYAFAGQCAGDAWAVGLGTDNLGDTTTPRNEIRVGVRSPACEVLTVDHRCLYATPDCLPVSVSIEGPLSQSFILQEGDKRKISAPPGTYTVEASVTDEDVRPAPAVDVTSPVTVEECPSGDDGFVQTARLLPDERDPAEFFGLQFGADVAVDGDTALVGAPLDDDDAEDAGAAYVFTRSDGAWEREAKLRPDDGGPFDVLGYAVALDGDTALVGGNGAQDTGVVYVFTRSNGEWSQRAKLRPDDSQEFQYFGRKLDFEGNSALVGTFTGSAYVFTGSGGTWQQEAKLLPGDGEQYPFGESVGLSGDTALVGGQGLGATVFTRSGGSWTRQARLGSDNGIGWSIAIDGDTALVGAAGDVPTYVFTRADGSWTQQARLCPHGDAVEGFGRSVAFQGDTALVGNPLDDEFGENAGAVYAFTRADGSWSRSSKLTAYGGDEVDWFGEAVDLGGDIALVGAPYDDDLTQYAGAAYVFTR